MKNGLLLLLLLPLVSYSQDIVGIWVKNVPDYDSNDIAIEFKKNGTLAFRYSKTLKPIVGECGIGSYNPYIKYILLVNNQVNYIEFTQRSRNEIKIDVIKYKLENGKLYLPKEINNKGKKSLIDFGEEYIRAEE